MAEHTNPKRENLLNLALDATSRELELSPDLQAGYDREENTWELIFRYSADLEQLRQEYPQLSVTELLNGYGIVTLPERLMEAFTNRVEIEYIEKPKRLFFAVEQGIRASCMNAVRTPDFGLSGRGILCGLADSGIDWRHPDFCNADGTTRIRAIWDQSLRPDPAKGLTAPAGYDRGVEFTGEQINAALKEPSPLRALEQSLNWSGTAFKSPVSGGYAGVCQGTENSGKYSPEWNRRMRADAGEYGSVSQGTESPGKYSPEWNRWMPLEAGGYTNVSQGTENSGMAALQTDTAGSYVRLTGDSSGHGTHVAGILAGNGRASGGRYRGVAYESELIIVKLGVPVEGGFPSTVELMMAIDYMIRKAREWNLPLALNLSFGNNYGSHSGTSLIETYLDSLSGYWKNVIAIGTGNEGAGSIHTSGIVEPLNDTVVELEVSTYETSLSVQIWKSYADEFAIRLVHPSGQSAGPVQQILGPQRFRIQQTQILLYYGEPSPYSPYQEIYLEFLPVRDYLDSGVWQILLSPGKIVNGTFDMWLPGAGSLNRGTGFLFPTEQTTLTIPSTAEKVISVAAYNSRTNQAADFSGRGYTRETRQVKPDLAAPGVGIVSTVPGGGYGAKSGTSMATPFVAGSAALLMQWGIVDGNDPYLYGEKVKAYLIKGARPLAAFGEYPNPQTGWGALCLRDSLPG